MISLVARPDGDSEHPVVRILGSLASAGVPYCVLAPLDETWDGCSDVDLVVPRAFLPHGLAAVLRDVAARHGASVVHAVDHDSACSFVLAGRTGTTRYAVRLDAWPAH